MKLKTILENLSKLSDEELEQPAMVWVATYRRELPVHAMGPRDSEAPIGADNRMCFIASL